MQTLLMQAKYPPPFVTSILAFLFLLNCQLVEERKLNVKFQREMKSEGIERKQKNIILDYKRYFSIISHHENP